MTASDSLCMTLLWVSPPDPRTSQCSGSPLKRPERNARRWRLWFSSGFTSLLVLDMHYSVSRPTSKPDRPQRNNYIATPVFYPVLVQNYHKGSPTETALALFVVRPLPIVTMTMTSCYYT